jgi:hypothetical protein
MNIQLKWHEPVQSCVLWKFEGVIGVVDYLPPMNQSIQQAMINAEEDWFVLLDMRYAMPFPNRSFAMVARPIIGAPPNLKRVIISSQNPFTRTLIQWTLGREPLLKDRLHVVSSYADGVALLPDAQP